MNIRFDLTSLTAQKQEFLRAVRGVAIASPEETNLETPLQMTCRAFSKYTKEVIKFAEQEALKRLESKTIIKTNLASGGVNYIAVESTADLPKEEKSFKEDYFIAVTGSIGREDDFTLDSDIDYIIFPSNEESIPFAKALQNEMDEVLKQIILQENLAFDVDGRLTNTYDFQIPIGQVPDKLLVTEYNMFEPEFDMMLSRPAISSRVFRDLVFLSGDKSGFDKLMEVVNPVLYPFGNLGSVQSAQGVKLLNQLSEEARLRHEKCAELCRSGRIDRLDVKDDGLRFFHLYNWATRSLFNMRETRSIADSFSERVEDQTLEPYEGVELSMAHDSLLKTKLALKAISDKSGISRNQNNSRVTRSNVSKVAAFLGNKEDYFVRMLRMNLQRMVDITSEEIGITF